MELAGEEQKRKDKNMLKKMYLHGIYNKVFVLLFVFSIFYVLPVILFNTCFNDDLGITLYGTTGLNGDGRPLGQFLCNFLSGGGVVADIGPLPLLCAMLILSYALVLYAKENICFSEANICVPFVLLLILTNPLSMSILFYRTGSFVMITALSIPFLLFSFNDEIAVWKMAIGAFVSGMAIMSLYQPAFGMCLVLVCINIVLWLLYDKNRIRNDIMRLIGLFLGAVVYMALIMPHYIDPTGWRHEASQTIEGVNLLALKTFLLNIWNSTFYVIDYLKGLSTVSKIFWVLFVVVAWGTSLYLGYIRTKDNKKKCVMTILVLGIAPCIIAVISYVPLAVLNSLGIKCRLFISFSGVLLYFGIFMIALSKRNRMLATIILAGYLLGQFSCMYSYANTVKNEAEYEKYLAYSIAHDIETINAENEYHAFSFSGVVPQSRKYELIKEKYPFYDEIVPSYFYNDIWIGAAWIFPYLPENINNTQLNEEDQAVVDNKDPFLSNSTYSCYVNEDKIIVAFHGY